MRKILSVLIALSFSGLGAIAGNVTNFGNNTPEAVAVLTSPGNSDTINFTLPAECHVLNATMDVSAIPPDGANPECPSNAQVFLNDTLLWQFNGTGYGPLGLQDGFANGSTKWSSAFGPAGGAASSKIRVPKTATIQNATLDINCTGPRAFQKYLTTYGTAEQDWYGYSVSDAGDVNNDGFDDIIVGAMYNDAGGGDAGRAYIYFGGKEMNTTPDVVLTGETAGENFGISVSSAGDVNKDGYDDVIVGADRTYVGGPDVGRAYIYYGGAAMDNVSDVVLTGLKAGGNYGVSVSDAGDVNGDGYGDVIVGAFDDSGGDSIGQAFVYYGGASMDSTADVTLTGGAFEWYGVSVSGAGDVNKDGYDDVVVGEPFNNWAGWDAGRAFVYYGGASMDNVADVVLTGPGEYDFTGLSVSGAGDVNGDGYADVIVGAYGAGQAYIYFGGASMDDSMDVVFSTYTDYFGYAVSGVGDVNNDGYDDVIIGGPLGGGGYQGAAFIFYGGANMDSVIDITLNGVTPGDYFGSAVSGAGDVDNDGYSDVIVGAYLNGGGGYRAGSATLYTYPSGIKEADVYIGSATVQYSTWYVNGSQTSRDFGTELDNYVSGSNVSGTDKYGNGFVDVPIQISGVSEGNMTLSDLRIAYSSKIAIPDFKEALNQYIDAHKAEKDASGNITIPLKIVSGTPGRLKLIDLHIVTDDAPELVKPIPDVEIPEDTVNSALLDLYEYVRDDHDANENLTFSISSATNDSIVAVAVSGNRYLSADALDGDLNDNWTGEVEAVVEAVDHWGSKLETNAFRITVTNVNDAPVITSQPPINAIGGQEYVYQITAVDGDNDVIAFALVNSPDTMTINASTGLIRWTPSKGGMYDVTVTASDGMLNTSQSFRIAVPNRLPRLTNETIPTAYVSKPYVFNIPVVDDDGDPLTFTLLTDIGGMAIDSTSGRLTWTPGQIGKFDVIVRISDGIDIFTDEFNISVVQGNRDPTISSSPITSAIVGIPYAYDVNGTDMDGDTLTFALADMPAGMTIDNATGMIHWTPAAIGNFTVKVKVMDGKGGEGSQDLVIKVGPKLGAKVEFTTLTGNQNIKGKIVVNGKATQGTLAVTKVQIRIDSGDWVDANGSASWQYTLDTTKLKNGKHSIQARAFDGMDYSNIINLTVNVDNSKSSGKGFIPGFELPLIVLAMTLLLIRRRLNQIRSKTLEDDAGRP